MRWPELNNDSAVEIIRARGLQVIVAIALILALGPTAYPARLAAEIEAAVTAFEAGWPELALPSLESALALEPGLGDTRLLAIESALSSGAVAQAMFHLEALPSALQSSTTVECMRLDAAIRSGEVQGLLKGSLGSRLSACSEQIDALASIARASMSSRDYELAEQLYRELAPFRPQISADLGLLLAVADPESALSHLRLGIDLRQPRTELAEELIQTIELSRDGASRSYSLAQVGQTLARAGEWSLAAIAFENALAIDPEYTEARAYYGLALDRSGSNGLDQLLQAADEAPNAPLPQVLLGKHWRSLRESDRALEAFEQAAVLAPQDPLIAVDLAAAYAAVGDLPAAELAYQYAVTLEPDNSLLWSFLAKFALDYEIRLAEVGLPAARNSLLFGDANPENLDMLGFTHFLLGNWTIAQRFLHEAIAADPELAAAHYHLALVSLANDDLAAGIRELDRVFELDPEGRYGMLARRSLETLSP